MPINSVKSELLTSLRSKSLVRGDFTLSSGAKSKYYVDCKLTTLDSNGAWLVGQIFHNMIRAEEEARGVKIDGVGGLTMGADPIAIATGMVSKWANDAEPLQVFIVRKTPKQHGQTKQIEGNFSAGDRVVIIDDVVTRGDSTLRAVDAVKQEGGIIEFVAVLVDRMEGGKEKIEAAGIKVISVFTKDDLLNSHVELRERKDFVAA
ncbi:MAG: orotate phosphoribosyltransferase [Verrucomicrobia bacterium]|nr:orotate phosphoribosyltransferase [Verrucomicrobiota bacterium]